VDTGENGHAVIADFADTGEPALPTLAERNVFRWKPRESSNPLPSRTRNPSQDKAVFVYRLVAAATIEEKMDELKARKRALSDGLFDRDGRVASALTEEDVKALFED
jgi:hypothetical protein